MRTQFIVQESNKIKREFFYNYIKDIYHFSNWYPYNKKLFIESRFPFVIDFKTNSFWVCESITCCAAIYSKGYIMSVDEFVKIYEQ